MASIGITVGSNRMALAEALSFNHRTGLTIPELVRASKVPRNTTHRILKDFKKRGLIKVVGKVGKAEIYKLDVEKHEAIGLVRAANAFTQYVSKAKAQNVAVDNSSFIMKPSNFIYEPPERITVDYEDEEGGEFQVTKHLVTGALR